MEWNTLYNTQGSYRASIFRNFPDLKKVSKMEMKSEKIVKKILSFFFSKLQQIVLYEWNVFRFGQILFNFARMFAAYHEKKTLFLRFLRSLLITNLFDNLESGKRNYCFGKKSGKSLEFISWYLCRALTVVKKRISPRFKEVKQGWWNGRKRIVTIPVPLVPRRTSMRTQAPRDFESRLRLTPFWNMLLSFLFICHLVFIFTTPK